MRSRRRRRFLAGLLVAGCIGAAFCIAFWFNLLSGMQLQGSDFLFKAASVYRSSGPEARIVIIGIDEKSLDQLGHLPSWPRSYHAHLIDVLTEAEARVVVFDILFSEPALGDEQLAETIKDAGNVILPIVYASAQNESTGVGESMEPGSFIRSLSIFEEGAAALGHANVLPDEDGVVRRLPLAIRNGEVYEPALALATVAKYLRRPQAIESPIENNRLSFAGRSIPLDDANGMLINYVAGSADAGAPVGFQTVSYVDTLRGEVDPAIFQDKIVVIGATASGLGDILWTPTGRMMNGVEIHANTIRTILTGDFLRSAPSNITIALIMILALLCGLLVLRLRVLWVTLSAFFICVAYFLTAFSFFDKGIMLNMVYPPLAILGTFVGVNLFNITAERSEKREITKTFGRYVSSSVVEGILTALEEGALNVEGQQQEVTIAFADVRGFTSMSENMQPEELVRVLNIYLSVVIKEVLRHEGMINKFGGDSVMAIWNVPTRCEGHALLATKAAIDAQHAIRELQQSDAALPKVDFSIGINTGKAVAGNLGSEDRLEYSVVGDVVNIAARLTSLAEGGKVWIGSDAYDLIRDYCVAKPLGTLELKGKRELIRAYEVMDIRQESVDLAC